MRKTLIRIILVLTPFLTCAIEEIFLKDGIEISKQMEKDDVFFRRCMDLDLDEKYLYMIALVQSRIFKIEIKTGKFIRSIGSKGQGPGELSFALNIAVKNNRVFIVDQGFGGIKIFTTDGKLINEFKINGALSRIGIEVDNNDHIYLGKLDFINKSMVSVYDLKGNKLRHIISHDFDLRRDRNLIRHHEYRMDMDKSGNIYILFPVIQKIRKYSNDGNLIWDNNIENELLGSKINSGGSKAYYNGEKVNYLTREINDFEITDDYYIIISQSRGGSILDKNGKLKKLIKLDKTDLIQSLRLIKLSNKKIINVCNYNRNVVVFSLGGINEKD